MSANFAGGNDPDAPAIRVRTGVVVAVERRRPGLARVVVEVDGGRASALAYPALVGEVAEGDRVVLNTTALDLGLGTGGAHVVIAVEPSGATDVAHRGRVMKARYLPHQAAVRSVEETHADALERAGGLGGVPVVAAPLHSMVGLVAAGAKASAAARVVYVMTDAAALPGRLSDLVHELRAAELLDGFVTVGQAFGGDLEAITLWSGLLAAVAVLEAEIVVVADGPGNLGTATTWGVSALGSGHALDAADTLGGQPVAALRISFADDRERHRVVSHHSLTILAQVCHVSANVAVPVLDDEGQRDAVWNALRSRKLEERHQLVEVDGRPALGELERRGVAVRSMGRSVAEDPAFFLSSGAAGVLAGRMAAGARRYRRG
jgi:Protein of unknown function (DUF3866)